MFSPADNASDSKLIEISRSCVQTSVKSNFSPRLLSIVGMCVPLDRI